ncbi:ATP-grasp domain-containing protein [Actinomyces sp.]|uniref:D-alanine--D-alanine ligase family protein n=1 Tax=Actinomyces sp. TaxID=29317 RepID=UPI0026DABACF|nr:ATP-grasp domain-containing protein [Actinomyces sp.]MDO4900733.1 ATP-grasp domain-containing protein [Actinomyces sp.]
MSDTPEAKPGAPLRIAVIAGGLSHERDVSLRSGHRVMNILKHLGHTVVVLDVDARTIPSLRAFSPDVVWPLVHGGHGEDGGLQNVLIALGLPYVGTHSDGCQRASFKPTAKASVRAAGVRTPDSVTLPKAYFSQLGAQDVLGVVAGHLGLPVVVKPNQGGSGLGVSYASNADELRTAMVSCFAYDERALIENYVEGTELAVSVVDTGDGPRALPPVEVVSQGRYDFDARYNPGRSEYFVPARLEDDLLHLVQDMAVTVHSTLGLGNLSRTDIILDAEATPWFIDVNVVPGMTEVSLLPMAANADGDLAGLYDQLVRHPAVRPQPHNVP